MLLFFSLILNYSVRSLYSHTNSYNNAVTQCHVDGAQRAWATCGLERARIFFVFLHLRSFFTTSGAGLEAFFSSTGHLVVAVCNRKEYTTVTVPVCQLCDQTWVCSLQIFVYLVLINNTAELDHFRRRGRTHLSESQWRRVSSFISGSKPVTRLFTAQLKTEDLTGYGWGPNLTHHPKHPKPHPLPLRASLSFYSLFLSRA